MHVPDTERSIGSSHQSPALYRLREHRLIEEPNLTGLEVGHLDLVALVEPIPGLLLDLHPDEEENLLIGQPGARNVTLNRCGVSGAIVSASTWWRLWITLRQPPR